MSLHNGESFLRVTHISRRQWLRGNDRTWATLLPGLEAGGPRSRMALRAPRRALGSSLCCAAWMCLRSGQASAPVFPLPSCLAFPSVCSVLPWSLAYSCFFLFFHLSSLKWPLWPRLSICAFPMHLSKLVSTDLELIPSTFTISTC